MDAKTYKENFNMLIHELLNGKEWEERANAALKLGYLKDARAINSILKAVKKEENGTVINRIIEALGRIGDPKATMLIVDYLKKELKKPEIEQNKNRLFLIIESLMKLGDKRSLQHLGLLLNSCDEEIKNLTEKAFECIDPKWKNNFKKS